MFMKDTVTNITLCLGNPLTSYLLQFGSGIRLSLDCEQSLQKSVDGPSFLRQSCFVMQTNKKTEGGSLNLCIV